MDNEKDDKKESYLDFKAIGLKIKECRQSMDMTQEYLANLLDINASHISNIEGGRANPSLTLLVKIADILQCSVDCFLCDEYKFKASDDTIKSIDDEIIQKLQHCTTDKKEKILKIIDII